MDSAGGDLSEGFDRAGREGDGVGSADVDDVPDDGVDAESTGLLDWLG